MTHTLHIGDCRDILKSLKDCSIDAIVTDPPYELGFMGKAWDASGIAYERAVWAQCLRVLKPGGHLIAFGGSRTYHRLAVAIEDAGFEIRDQIQWIYGSGFPKSLDVSKAMDKQRHDRAQVLEVTAWIRSARDASGLSNADIDAAFGFHGMSGHWTSSASQPSVPTLEQIPPLLALFGLSLDDVPDDVRTLIWTLNGRKGQPGEAWYQREVLGDSQWKNSANHFEPGKDHTQRIQLPITAPATDLAKRWHGWGTALKPAHEPAVLARKLLTGTVADNVTAWGTGALNIEGTRIAEAGRWPSNVIFDEEAAQVLDAQSGERKSGGENGIRKRPNSEGWGMNAQTIANGRPPDSGGASRFFYVAKASKAEREAGLNAAEGERANRHPTIKPLALMRYLIRMVTPPGGVVLDPFMGSGSTGCAAVAQGFDFIGIDIIPEYVEIAHKRIVHHEKILLK